MRGLVKFGVRNPVASNLLMVTIVAGGIYTAHTMVRERYPEFSIDRVVVEVVYPGAGPADIEASICTPIEQAIAGVHGIRELTSQSVEGAGLIIAFLNEGTSIRQAVDDIRLAVESVNTLPLDAKKPVVRELVLRTGVINVTVLGDAEEATLKEYARDVRDELTALPEISQVALWGDREREIVIEVPEDNLRAYNLSFAQIMNTVRANSLDLPAGVLRTRQEEFTLRVTGRGLTASDYEDLVVLSRPDGTRVTLGQVARVREEFEESAVESQFDGKPALTAAVYKTPDQDTVDIARRVREYVQSKQEDLPPGVRLVAWADGAFEIDSRLQVLLVNGLMGLGLMVLALTMFMRWRVAFWVMAGLPVAYAGAMITLWATGHGLNLISMFGLLMVGGMIDDDAIVISEAIYARCRRGEAPERATIEGAMDVAMPVVGSSLTTIIAFIPLFFVTGIIGKFVREVPLVIIAALSASLFEVLLLLPPHLCHHGGLEELKPGAPEAHRLRRFLDRVLDVAIAGVYEPLHRFMLRHRHAGVAAAVAMVLVCGGLVLGGRMRLMLLESDDNAVLRARVAFPEGTPSETARRVSERLESAAWTLNDDDALKPHTSGALVQHVYRTSGMWSEIVPRHGNNLCEVKVELMNPAQRWIRDEVIVEHWRKAIGDIGQTLTFAIEPDTIAPTDRPIQVRLMGPDLGELRAAADDLETKLLEFDGVWGVRDDLTPGKRELRVALRPEARGLGLTLADLALQLRQGFFGGDALRLQRGRDEIWVKVRYPGEERQEIEDIENVHLRTAGGTEVPFHEAATIEWTRGYASIGHEAGQRRVEVYADIDERYANAEQIADALSHQVLADVVAQHDGMHFRIAGQRELINESLSSLYKGAILAMIGMYAALALMLGSYLQPLVIMSAIPVGLVGALGGHIFMGYDLTLMSLFGMLGLSGIVVNNVLVLMDFVNQRMQEGASVHDAVVESGKARFMAVTLTSLTTVVGTLPVCWDTSGQAYTVIPMAISMTFGLTFCTIVTLILVPAMFLCANDLRRVTRWLVRGGAFPTAEEVEPGHRVNASAEQREEHDRKALIHGELPG